MRAISGTKRFDFDSPAVYRIRAQGKVPAFWSERLEGMTIHLDEGGYEAENVAPITTMEGELLDQSALAGVLRTLYEMHLPVLSVECLSAKLARSSPV